MLAILDTAILRNWSRQQTVLIYIIRPNSYHKFEGTEKLQFDNCVQNKTPPHITKTVFCYLNGFLRTDGQFFDKKSFWLLFPSQTVPLLTSAVPPFLVFPFILAVPPLFPLLPWQNEDWERERCEGNVYPDND